jgi:hypothetical protein
MIKQHIKEYFKEVIESNPTTDKKIEMISKIATSKLETLLTVFLCWKAKGDNDKLKNILGEYGIIPLDKQAVKNQLENVVAQAVFELFFEYYNNERYRYNNQMQKIAKKMGA